ncbi:MAG: ABC transporter permease [Flammeovirgaceae bacterium]|nr:ABC transporter permease [Flammeovirgaceae bacterium]
MDKNYFVLFIRNLKSQRLFSIINLLGLTVSIASTVLIYLYVAQEFSYDRFHANADRIYRVNQTFIWGEADDAQFVSYRAWCSYCAKRRVTRSRKTHQYFYARQFYDLLLPTPKEILFILKKTRSLQEIRIFFSCSTSLYWLAIL